MVTRLTPQKFPEWVAACVAHVSDVVVASDPGLMRLRLAIRASATAAVSALVLSRLAAWTGHPVSVTIIGVAIGMLGTVVLSDATLEDEKKTLALVPLVAGAAAALAMLTASSVWASSGGFCAVIFASVYVRRYGVRATALGVIAFIGYFFALYFASYFGGGVSAIPWTEGAIVLSGAIAYVIRFGVVRERPQAVLEETLLAFEARARVMFDDLAVLAMASGAGTRHRVSRRIRRAAIRLNETALALGDQVGADRADAVADAAAPWVAVIFDMEMAVNTLAEAIRELSGPGVFDEGRRHLADLAGALRQLVGRTRVPHARAKADGHLYAGCTAREPALHATCRDAHHAIHALDTCRPWPHPTACGDRAQSLLGAGAPLVAPVPRPPGEWFSPPLRLAIQATIAGGLSMVAGRQISSVRWFWAVISAFVVFIRANTIGETLSRGWQRTLGTMGGVAGGVIVAQLVGGDPHVALGLIFVGLFGAYYFYRVSYAWMIGFITAALALLYTVLGRYSQELLYIRLVETLAGAIIGIVVATIVLPERSSVKLRWLTADVIRMAARSIIDATRVDAAGDATRIPTSEATATDAGRAALKRRRISDARAVDRALQNLWLAATALMGRNTPLAASPITRCAHNAAALVYALRQLGAATSDGLPAAVATQVSDAGHQLADACIAVAEAMESGRRPVMHGPRELIARLHADEACGASAPAGGPARWLERIDRIVTDLASTAGASEDR